MLTNLMIDVTNSSRPTFEQLLLHQTKTRGPFRVCYNMVNCTKDFSFPDSTSDVTNLCRCVLSEL